MRQVKGNVYLLTQIKDLMDIQEYDQASSPTPKLLFHSTKLNYVTNQYKV